MKKIGTVGEYVLIEEGLWCGTIDKEGKMHISPDLHYRGIHEFVDGVAVACQRIDENDNLKWGLIDTEGNHISEFKYSYVEAWGEGYYKCEIGNKKNLLRRDGSEVLKEWFNDVYKVMCGLFVIGNTIRKTKDHPTLYPRGLASVNGDILFPPIFNLLHWHDEVKLDFLYAEIQEKPYVITKTGFIIDPAGDHLPKLSKNKDNFVWNGPKNTICDGCIFSDGINPNGEGCRKLLIPEFRNNVIKGKCEFRKEEELEVSCHEYWDKYNEEKAIDKASKVSDEYARKLVKDFIKDKLNGDITQLAKFNFREMKHDEKYGDCNGFSYSPEKTNIMKAIMTLVFSNAWPEISYDGFDHYVYNVSIVNTYSMLLGAQLGESFKGMQKFRPSADMLDRAWRFIHLCDTVGNYVVWAGNIGLCRENLRRSQRYIDTFLQAIHLAITNPKKGNIDLLKVINKSKKVYAPYRNEDGASELFHKLYLDSYFDSNGKPMRLFDGIWSDQKDLTREAYFNAIEQYFDFCEKEILRRSNIIIQRLIKVLGMKDTLIETENVITLDMPKEFTVIGNLPGDPEGAISYGYDTQGSLCFVQTYPIDAESCMPMEDNKPIIDGIHQNLADNQGIVEVINGTTRYEKHFVYSIVKSGREPHGMNYILTMHLEKLGKVLCVKGQFEERGTTGGRDAAVYEYACRNNLIKDESGEGWFEDPYDKEFTRGLRMNLSEKDEFDSSFPEHPLSQMRKFIAYIINYN